MRHCLIAYYEDMHSVYGFSDGVGFGIVNQPEREQELIYIYIYITPCSGLQQKMKV